MSNLFVTSGRAKAAAGTRNGMVYRYSPDLSRRAIFSPCSGYRYALLILDTPDDVPAAECCAFIGLNPSTADEFKDDPTVRRCRDFARRWGYRGLLMLNAYGFRSTDPKRLRTQEDPVGRDTDRILRRYAQQVGRVMAAWGTHADLERVTAMRKLLQGVPTLCLGVTKDGHPKHPLYIRGTTEPTPWTLSTEPASVPRPGRPVLRSGR